MEYKDNSMESAMRCIVFALSGDGKVSDEEFEASLAQTDSLEQWFQFNSIFSSAVKDVFSDLFGAEKEETSDKDEEEEIVFEAISEETLKEIVKDVLSQTAKCKSTSDFKTYASLITSSLSNEDLQGRISYLCFELCGVDTETPFNDVELSSLSDHIAKKEIRNIKYLCSCFNQDFKSLEESFLKNKTFYDDHFLEESETVELAKSEIPFGENTPMQILKIGFICAYSDLDFSMNNLTLMQAYFMILCDIARDKGEKVIKVHSGEDILNALNSDKFVWENKLDQKVKDDVDKMFKKINTDLENNLEFNPHSEEYDGPRQAWSEECYKVLKEELKLITDPKIQKLTYKYAYLISQADEDDAFGQVMVRKINLFSDEDRIEKQELSFQELHCLDLIREHYDFDEDMLYGLQKRLEDGEFFLK